MSISEAFDEAVESGQWVTDARVDYAIAGGSLAAAAISRYGVFTLRNRSSTALSAMLPRAVDMAASWYEFLKNRARTKESHFRSRPFDIAFKFPALESGEQVGLLRAALLKIPRTTCTVVHGNPYFHAVLSDFGDGSTYEVLVLQDKAITVIPQGRASVHALQRLCSHVFSDFREGELVESATE